MAVAGYRERVFRKVLVVHDKWKKKMVKDQQKKPLNQSTLKGIYIGGITDNERINLMECILTVGFKAYRVKTE